MNSNQLLATIKNNYFLTDGGLETTLIFHHGMDLPEFASFPLVNDHQGVEILKAYYQKYTGIAENKGLGFILEAPTWRANADWGEKLGYNTEQLATVNIKSIDLMHEIKSSISGDMPLLISGCIGPRGDGYNPEFMMSAEQAQDYHNEQILTLSKTSLDLITAMTMTYPEEAIGITRAAKEHGVPVVISMTPETDGKLLSGYTIREMIQLIDEATESYVTYYMINCAHPSHFDQEFDLQNDSDQSWKSRIFGVRANASSASHEELDEATELDDGNPVEFGHLHQRLKKLMPHLSVIGGCCGTDHRHVTEASHCLSSSD